MELERIRILADVYTLEIANGAVVRNRSGSLEIMGKGAYRLLSWIFPTFDGSRSYLDAIAGLPQPIEQQVRAIVKRLLERHFARILAQDEAHAHPLRAQYPELYNLLEYRTATVTQAWQAVLSTTVRVTGDGRLKQAVLTALPDYGLRADTGNRNSGTATIDVLAADSAAAYRRTAAAMRGDAIAIRAGLLRHNSLLYGLAAHDRADLPGASELAVFAQGHGVDEEALLPPAALAIAAHALCLELFESIALAAAPAVEPRLLLVDELTLTLSHHRLPPRVLVDHAGVPEGQALEQAEGWVRPDLGGSILPVAQTEALNAIARSVAALTDARVGPLLRVDDDDLFQLPLAAAVALNPGAGDGRPRRILTLGLSARETHNQGALAAIEDYYALGAGRGTVAAGWSEREAVLRAGRMLFERDAGAWLAGTPVACDWAGASATLTYLAELFDDTAGQLDCVRNRHGWYMARHRASLPHEPEHYGVGVLPELALGDLLLKLSVPRFYPEARFDVSRPVLLGAGVDQSLIARALADAMAGVVASLLPPLPPSRDDACPLYLVELRTR